MGSNDAPDAPTQGRSYPMGNAYLQPGSKRKEAEAVVNCEVGAAVRQLLSDWLNLY